ncbi:hypothetical protein MKR42_12015, partial [Staphylococcus haemolyticus]|nr:hypothetical protein [Staphylococcus haemolyticus]
MKTSIINGSEVSKLSVAIQERVFSVVKPSKRQFITSWIRKAVVMLDINVASIKTTVSFVVDKQSLAEARKAGDDLKKYFEKIADPKIRFQAQKQRRQKARQQADDARFNDKPRDTKEMKAQRAAEKQKVRDEKANLKAKQQLQKR